METKTHRPLETIETEVEAICQQLETDRHNAELKKRASLLFTEHDDAMRHFMRHGGRQ